jgi:hypothetical protein
VPMSRKYGSILLVPHTPSLYSALNTGRNISHLKNCTPSHLP